METTIKDKIDKSIAFLNGGINSGFGDEIASDAARAVLNALFPNDFEYYTLAIEVVDSKDNTFAYMMFPVMPSSYSDSINKRVSIRETISGVTTTTKDTFVPIPIDISGNFGRRLKVMVGKDMKIIKDAVRVVFAMAKGDLSYMKSSSMSFFDTVFDDGVKTGYGAMKFLEFILSLDGQRDTYGKPYRLYLYNPSVGNNYLIKVLSFRRKAAATSFAIWNYSASLVAVAPLDYIISKESEKKSNRINLGVGFAQHTVNSLLNTLRVRI